jgi:serine/threonine protein kinase
MSGELELGARLGRFQLLYELGRGGMASVWVARERSPKSGKHRLVAVKAMLPKLAKRMDFRSMFLDEGQLVRSIDHPNVVSVYEVGEDSGVLYMAMEWVEGDSLYTIIKVAKQRRSIPPEQAVRIIADTAAGLHVAHELRGWDGELRGVVHCDVSPHNILVGLDGMSKLVDFGVAHAVATSEGASERIAGKAGYMSPEQAKGDPIDRRSDLFSLGIVLFELTTGRRLFKGRDKAHTMHLVHIAEVPKPSSIFPGYPEKLEAIVLKALARDRDQRFQTAEEFAQALDHYLVEERIMVARSSTGQLLRRVLGDRIQQRRDAIKRAHQVLRGGGQPSLPEIAGDIPLAEVSVPSASLSALSELSLTTDAGTSDVQPGPGSLGSTPGPAVRAARPRSASSLTKVIAPLVLVAGAGGVYWWTVLKSPPTPKASVVGAKPKQSVEGTQEQSHEADEGTRRTTPEKGEATGPEQSSKKGARGHSTAGRDADAGTKEVDTSAADEAYPLEDAGGTSGDGGKQADAGPEKAGGDIVSVEGLPEAKEPQKPATGIGRKPVVGPRPKKPPKDDDDMANPYR